VWRGQESHLLLVRPFRFFARRPANPPGPGTAPGTTAPEAGCPQLTAAAVVLDAVHSAFYGDASASGGLAGGAAGDAAGDAAVSWEPPTAARVLTASRLSVLRDCGIVFSSVRHNIQQM
jgi:hypothetical protein